MRRTPADTLLAVDVVPFFDGWWLVVQQNGRLETHVAYQGLASARNGGGLCPFSWLNGLGAAGLAVTVDGVQSIAGRPMTPELTVPLCRGVEDRLSLRP